MTVDSNPQYLLFAQHGWADTNKNIGRLAQAAAEPDTRVIVPNLGLVKTFIRLKFLVAELERIVKAETALYPNARIRILGHSMGGVMWLEVLERNPQWWSKIHSFILLGSPVGGSNIARIIDPFGIGIGTAADLGKNRRATAEKIARCIPTLSVASDMGMGTDGLVTVENTKFDYANWQLISGIAHSAMRYDADMIPILQNFWRNPQLGSAPQNNLSTKLIRLLRDIPGITDADRRGFERSQIVARLPDALTVHTWQNWGMNHVYLAREQECLYSGYVGLIHAPGWYKVLQEMPKYTS